MFVPSEHERTFSVKPVGVKYICEHCGEGEMIADTETPLSIPVNAIVTTPMMRPHRCTKCNGKLLLPKVYPYIEWIPEE
jgi:DNA-directed RNA polymerase subunit RPC12/RpoP